MYLYLIRGDDISFVFHNICLMGGYLPHIGDSNGVVSDSAKSIAADLEPAIWFKVSVLDHITVDCSQKVLKWSMQTLEQEIFTESLNNSSLRVTRSLYLENEYDSLECSLDTLFEAGMQLADSLVANSPESHKLLLTFLTDYVLPEVKISREDEEIVRAAMQRQTQLIEKLDMDIDARAVKINRLRQTLRDFRMPVVEDFLGTGGKLKKSRPELHEAICNHLQKDINEADMKLRMVGEQYAAAAAGSSNTLAAEAEQELAEARARADELKKAHNKLLAPSSRHAPVLKRNLLTSTEFLRDRKPIHDLYMASSQVVETLRKESTELLRNKVAAMSVKEAMRSVLQDLCCVEETVGYETQAGTGRMPTDIHANPAKSAMAFTSIVEKIRAILRDPAHPACQAYEDFCSETQEKCSQSVASHAAATVADVDKGKKSLVSVTATAAAVGDSRGGSLSSGGASDDFEHVERPSLKDTCEEVRLSVATHCASVVNIVRLSDVDSLSVKQRKRLCYEYYLYERIGKDLLALFYALHGGDTGLFVSDLSNLTADDLQFTEPWQARLLAEARSRPSLPTAQPWEPRVLEPQLAEAPSVAVVDPVPPTDVAGVDMGSGVGSDSGRCLGTKLPRRVRSVRAALPPFIDDVADNGERADAKYAAAGLDRLRLGRDSDSDDYRGDWSSDADALPVASAAAAAEVPATGDAAAPSGGSREGQDPVTSSSLRPLSQHRRSHGNRRFIADDRQCPGDNVGELCEIWQRDIFTPAIECMQKMTLQPSPLGKLQLLTRCLRIVAASEGKLRHYQHRPSSAGRSGGAASAASPQPQPRPPSTCSDDLIAATTLLLLCAETTLLYDVCVQLKFVEAFMNDCLQSGVHAFSLATVEGAVWHLRDLVLMKRRSRRGAGSGSIAADTSSRTGST